MTIHMVSINNDTTGTIDTDTLDGQHPDAFIGEMVTIQSHDENGFPCEFEGILTEVFD